MTETLRFAQHAMELVSARAFDELHTGYDVEHLPTPPGRGMRTPIPSRSITYHSRILLMAPPIC